MFYLGPFGLKSRLKKTKDEESSDHPGPESQASRGKSQSLGAGLLRRELTPYLPYVNKLAFSSSSRKEEILAANTKRKPWINLRELRDWIRTCERQHHDHCNSGLSHASASPWHGPLWLIDTRHRNLVPYKDGMQYFALSYVWGSCSGPEFDLCLQKNTVKSMQKDRFFVNEKKIARQIPRLIEDVIEVVRRLDSHQYLWIDRYCIMQDDGPAKDAQINAMNAIYAGAFATIVAADSSADDGLRGIKHHSEPRQNRSVAKDAKEPDSQHMLSATGSSDLVDEAESFSMFRDFVHEEADPKQEVPVARSRGSSYDSWDSFVDYEEHSRNHAVKRQEQREKDRSILEAQAYSLLHSPWYSRGWTFQESLFSRRKIVFQNETVNWECHCAAWYEGQDRSSDAVKGQCARAPSASMDGGFDLTTWPDLYRYARLVALFNRRMLSYPEDALYAFAGVMNSLSRTLKFGFISGLPQMFFHSTLIWQPYRPIKRRVAKYAEHPILPSWSWAGWHGIIQYESLRSGYAYVTSVAPTTWKTIETVKWFRLDDGGERHSIKSLETMFNNNEYIAGDGWQAVSNSGQNPSNTIWRHKDIEDAEFWKPVELRDLIKAHVPPVLCRYITATTRKAVLKAGASFQDTNVSHCTSVDLIGDHGEWIGVLRLPSESPSNEIYEVIELSRGSVKRLDAERNTFEEWERPGFQSSWHEDVYEFYNVTAISWKDSIAYREAVGRIERKLWDLLSKEEIELTLG